MNSIWPREGFGLNLCCSHFFCVPGPEIADVIRATSLVALSQQCGWLKREGRIGEFFSATLYAQVLFQISSYFCRTLVFYHAFYSKAKPAGYVESFYLKQLRMPDKYISNLGKRFHSSNGELQYSVVAQYKCMLQWAKFTAKQVNHCHSWNRSYLICCGSKTKVVQYSIFQEPLAHL